MFVLSLVCFACGSSSNSDSDEGPTSYTVNSTTDLPTCETSRIGNLVYVEDQGIFMTCKSSGWQEISIQGQDGSDGSDGRDGITLLHEFVCNDAVVFDFVEDPLPDDDTHIDPQYSILNEFSDGSYFYTSVYLASFGFIWFSNFVRSEDVQNTGYVEGPSSLFNFYPSTLTQTWSATSNSVLYTYDISCTQTY